MNLTNLPSPNSKLEGDARASRAEQAETPDWKALTTLIMKRAEASINSTSGVSASSAQATLATGTTVVADAASVEVNGADVVMSPDSAIELVEQQIAFQAYVPALTSCEHDGRGELQVDMLEKEAILEESAGLSNLEEIIDLEELAHNLRHSGLAPHSDPRIEALFRRAALGNGFHSQLIRASGLI
ncbi:hypothetical protein [Bradyrhizobium lablabi]|uniref:hypothetical protein n=1 Tax=Bradyrhizobium lablabi TaxID=722472 RepID=UPI000B29551F|nr:hypothetical protein [Bradyrhizobium lablabi]